jgi:hypothetical protein
MGMQDANRDDWYAANEVLARSCGQETITY